MLKKFPAVVILVGMFLSSVSYAQDITINVASTSKAVIDNLPFYVGEKIGAFEKRGIKIVLTHFHGGGEVVRAVSAGTADIGMVATSSAIIAAGRGEPIRLFSAWTAPAYAIVWIAPKGSPIKSAKDLRGKNVGISRPGSVSHTGLLAALKTTGIGDDVTITPVGGPGDSWAAVKNGRVAASWNTEPSVLSLVSSGKAQIVFGISQYLHDYAQGSLVANQEYMEKHRDSLANFLEAIRESDAYVESNPKGAAKIGAEAMGLPEKQVLDTVEAAPHDFFKVGPIPQANYEGSLKEALRTGALHQAPAMSKTVDDSLVR